MRPRAERTITPKRSNQRRKPPVDAISAQNYFLLVGVVLAVGVFGDRSHAVLVDANLHIAVHFHYHALFRALRAQFP